MNMREFREYLEDNIMDYLPPSYEDAEIHFKEVVKHGDQHLTGMVISRPGESVVPTIYVDHLYEEYLEGRDIEEIVGDVADIRIRNEVTAEDRDILYQLLDYEYVKDKLQVRICDTNENQERLSKLVHSERSDFSATYHVILDTNSEGQTSVAVTPDVMKSWGVSMEQLHQDALAADMDRKPILSDMYSVMQEMIAGMKATNLLMESNRDDLMMDETMFCLTNQDKINAAGLLMQDDLMAQISDLLGGSYYILPSSIHELLIVPDRGELGINELSELVREVNRTQVSPQDRLSDEVQYYDKDSRTLENAQNRANRLENEKSEKAKEKAVPRSIHEKLEANKNELKTSEKKHFVKAKEKNSTISI